MRRLPLLCLILLSTTMVLSAAVSKESGVRCATPAFPDEFRNSSAVFVGEVTESEKVGDKKYFTFKVRHFWKGVNSPEIKIVVSENMRFQAPYEVGEKYLVFAKADDDGVLFDDRCSRSAEIDGNSSNLQDDLEKLGEPKTCIDLKEVEEEEVENEN